MSDDITSKLGDSIAEALTEEGDFVLKWFTVIEVISKDGQKDVWRIVSDDCEVWDFLGLLDYVKQKTRTQDILLHMLRMGEEEE